MWSRLHGCQQKENRKMSSEDWTVLESNTVVMDLVITDILILSKKDRAPEHFTTLENTTDGKKADFPEGMLGHTRRYLCFTRKSPSPTKGRVAVTELKVISSSERPPLGYAALTYTHDDNTKAFSSKQLLAKFTPLEQATQAVTDIVVLSPSRKEDVPAGYQRLPEINGFSVCFKVTRLPKKGTHPSPPTTSAQQLRPQQLPQQPDSPINRQPSTLVKRVRSAIDGVTFQLKDQSDTQQNLVKFALGQLKLLSLEDVESKIFNTIGQNLNAGWLKCVLSLINTDGSIPALKTLPGKVIPQTLPRVARRVWGPDYPRPSPILPQSPLMNLHNIINQFDYDWSEWKEIANRT